MGHAWIVAVLFVVISYLVMSRAPGWHDDSWSDAVQQFMLQLEFGWKKIVVMIVVFNVLAFAVVLAYFWR